MKRRARQVCIICHMRKVRCDIAARGRPCSNCISDGQDCKPRARKVRQLKRTDQTADVQSTSNNNTSVPSQDNVGLDFESGNPPNPPLGNVELYRGAHGVLHNSNVIDPTGVSTLQAQAAGRELFDDARNISWTNEYDGAEWNVTAAFPLTETTTLSSLPSSINHGFQGGATTSPISSDILNIPTSMLNFTFHNHLDQQPLHAGGYSPTTSNIGQTWYTEDELLDFSKFPASDISFLRSQGCLQLPARSTVAELGQVYFRYVHPFLPMLSEHEFWTSWPFNPQREERSTCKSLLLLRAVLFACITFAPQSVLQACGYDSVRSCRYAFYRRAKLLYDFETEADSVCCSQAALLLSYFASNENSRWVNSSWLGSAIQSARLAGADTAHLNADLSQWQKSKLKRLWWCCIIRDRVMPLGLRRALQIPPEHFEHRSGGHHQLTEADFAIDIERSQVFDRETHRAMIQLIIAQCELCEVLTDAIALVYPVEKLPISHTTRLTPEEVTCLLKRIDGSKSKLTAWYEKAINLFPPPLGLGDMHDTIVLGANLIFVYFNSGRIALCNYEVLLWETQSHVRGTMHQKRRLAIQKELSLSVSDTTARLKELLTMKLASYLPVSISAYVPLPLTLLLIDAKLSPSRSAQSLARRELCIYTEVMKNQRALFDGTEYVAGMVDSIDTYLEEEISPSHAFMSSPALSVQRSSESSGETESSCDKTHEAEEIQKRASSTPHRWQDLVILKPRWYLRLSVHIDIALAKAKMPEESDFPPVLRANDMQST